MLTPCSSMELRATRNVRRQAALQHLAGVGGLQVSDLLLVGGRNLWDVVLRFVTGGGCAFFVAGLETQAAVLEGQCLADALRRRLDDLDASGLGGSEVQRGVAQAQVQQILPGVFDLLGDAVRRGPAWLHGWLLVSEVWSSLAVRDSVNVAQVGRSAALPGALRAAGSERAAMAAAGLRKDFDYYLAYRIELAAMYQGRFHRDRGWAGGGRLRHCAAGGAGPRFRSRR